MILPAQMPKSEEDKKGIEVEIEAVELGKIKSEEIKNDYKSPVEATEKNVENVIGITEAERDQPAAYEVPGKI